MVAKSEISRRTRLELARPRSDVAAAIRTQIDRGEKHLERRIASPDSLAEARREVDNWRRYTSELLDSLFTTDEIKNDFLMLSSARAIPADFNAKVRAFTLAVEREISHLRGLVDRLELYDEAAKSPSSSHADATNQLALICERFHTVSRQLRRRHAARSTLEVVDEYDVQDLFHALLRLFFEDVRPEEWTPSYAGGASRMDFLLKNERAVVEVKMARPTLNARGIGDQLIQDIGRYRAHHDCKTLYCFVYDPEGQIANPRGVEHDLESLGSDLKVRVFIRP